MRWALFSLVVGVTSAPALGGEAQAVPEGYADPSGAGVDAATDPRAAPLPPESYMADEVAPSASDTEAAQLLAQSVAIRAAHGELLRERRRYSLGGPIAMAAGGIVGLGYSSAFLVSEKDSFTPDTRRVRLYRGLVGGTCLLVAGGIALLVWQVIRRREWKRRFIPVRERFLRLQELQGPQPTVLRW